MPQESDENTIERIRALEAQIEALRGAPSAALQLLEGHTDPQSIRRRLGIRIDFDQLDQAAAEIRNLAPSEMWADLGAHVLGGVGEIEKATAILSWVRSLGHPPLVHRTYVMYVDGVMRWLFRQRPQDSGIVPGSVTGDERHVLQKVASTIAPLSNEIIATRKVDTEVESQLLLRYLDVSYLIGDRDRVVSIADALLVRRPIPIKLGQVVLQGLIRATTEIATRLWEEHPDAFRARLLSCAVLARDLGDVATAKQRAKSLVALAKSVREREDLCELLYELSEGKGDEFAEVESITTELLGSDAYFLTLFRADQLVHANRHEEAVALLERHRDEGDPRWLRVYANAKVTMGASSEALDLFKRLSTLVPSPDVFRAIVRLSEEQGRFDDQRDALTQALALDPGNVAARWRLAMLFVKRKEYLEAAKHFEVLKGIQPDDENVLVNLAVSYSFAGAPEKALAALAVRSDHQAPFSLLRTRAQILEAAGRAGEAFQELDLAKEPHWDKPEFLVLYMTLGYACGREREAQSAIAKLHELRAKGLVDDRVMRPASLAEVRQLMEEGNKRTEEFRRLTLQGKIPWIAVAQLQRDVPLWAWLLRTQPLDWVWDEPLNRAAFAVYATNSYRALAQGQIATLEEIVSPEREQPVVIDLSALITLHELDLLRVTADFFGTLYVPAVYLERTVDESAQLLPHQASSKLSALDIATFVREGRITAVHTTVDSQPTFAHLDEYAEELDVERSPFRLKDLLSTLHQAGLIDDDTLRQAEPAAHKKAVSTADRLLLIGQRVLIGDLTLGTLHSLGLLPTVIREFSVHIAKGEYEEILARVRAFEALEEARSKYETMWATLKSDARVRFATAKKSLVQTDRRESHFELALSAMYLAQETTYPLLCDDRVVQAATLNERKEDRTAAFGTDALIVKLLDEARLSALQAATLFLRLFEWRYRFLLMPPELMRALADQHRSHPPGIALRRVARYVHDCMRDPGLFAGQEATTPPISIAIRLYQSWTQNISELVMDVWADPHVSEDYADEFTRWVAAELLPSPPRVLHERMQATIASLTPLTAFTRALIRGSSSTDFARINRGLRALATALGIEEKDYVSFVVNVVRGSDE